MRPLFKKHKTAWVVIAIGAILIVSVGYQCGLEKSCKIKQVDQAVRSDAVIQFPKGIIHAEVVDTPTSRAQGLSGRTSLGVNEGMLFVFDQPGRYGFWMKDMLFPIDMVWINEEGYIVHVENNVSPDTYTTNPPTVFINDPNASYVLELGAGQAERFGAFLGTKVRVAR